MSFFGFDTTLPRDRPGLGYAQDDEAEKRRLRELAGDEDLEVYTWGEPGFDDLAKQLHESGDDVNDETFGGEGPVGKDFDFGYGPSASTSGAGASFFEPAPSAFPQSKPQQQQQQQHQRQPSKPATPSLEALWGPDSTMPLAPKGSLGGQGGVKSLWGSAAGTPTPPRGSPFPSFAHPPLHPPTSSQHNSPFLRHAAPALSGPAYGRGTPPLAPGPSAPLTLEELEAALLANSISGPPAPAPPPALTLEQVESELLARQAAQQPVPFSAHYSPFGSPTLAPRPPPGFGPGPPQPPPPGFGPPSPPGILQQQIPQQQIPQQQQQQPPPRPPTLFPALPGRTPCLQLSSEDEARMRAQAEAMERMIRDQEEAEAKRRRKAAKIQAMSNFNHIMTPSDKSYILRLQLSSLATSDPYTEDFYAQVHSALMRRQQGVLNVGGMAVSVAGGSGRGAMGAGAVRRMREQVEKIVRNRKERAEKGSEFSLVGALGKTSARATSRNPRQMLQVSSPTSSPSPAQAAAAAPPTATDGASGLAAQAALGSLAAGSAAGPQPALTRRQALAQVEKLYDVVLQLEQMRRNQPPPAGPGGEIGEAHEEWNATYKILLDELWKGLRVMDPLELSDPHPFISLIALPKACKLLPRALRHLDAQQTLTLHTLTIACFGQLLPLLTGPRETEAFLGGVVPPFLAMVAGARLRLVAGMLALFVERNDVREVARSKPGIAYLTILLSRAEILKQSPAGVPDAPDQAPDAAELSQFTQIFDLFFSRLSSSLVSLFPSTRFAALAPFGQPARPPPGVNLDAEDEPVWRFLAALAVNADNAQQSALVTEVRDKVHEQVVAATQGWVDAESGARKITNVNVFLHALGLDSSQLAA